MGRRVDVNVEVCLDNDCRRCSPALLAEGLVPEDCPYEAVHALRDPTGLQHWQARRSGKTTAAVARANRLAARGKPVYLVTTSSVEARRVRTTFKTERLVRVVSAMDVRRGKLVGAPHGVFITDELVDSDQRIAREQLGVTGGHLFGGGFGTPREDT